MKPCKKCGRGGLGAPHTEEAPCMCEARLAAPEGGLALLTFLLRLAGFGLTAGAPPLLERLKARW